MKKVSIIANVGCIVVIIALAIPFLIFGMEYILENVIWMAVGVIGGMIALVPHELLHAICYRKDVYMYSDLAHGLLFVVGTEDMSKWRFVFTCLCPNIIFGWIPYIIFLVFPQLIGLGLFGIICSGMGFGDYLNAYNAIRQMPRNAKTYLCGMHSYWYLEECQDQ